MRRYEGGELPPGPRIAVVTNDALGNYVVATPLLQMLRERHKPSVLHYYGGDRTEELWQRDETIDWGYSLFGSDPHHAVLNSFVETNAEPYDLVVNIENQAWAKCFAAAIGGFNTFVCGPCLGADGRADLPFEANERGLLWADEEWIAEDITARYSFLKSGFIGEILCRLSYLDGDVPPYSVPATQPSIAIPDILIATAASLPEKLWPEDKWTAILYELSKKHSIGLLGAKATAQSRFWKGGSTEDTLVEKRLVQDLRGKLSLPEVVGALSKSRAVLTIDNGILHLAVSTGVPTIGLFRHGIHRLWAPPYPNLTVLTPGADKSVSEIGLDAVREALERAI